VCSFVKKWHNKTAELFPNELDLKDDIPDPSLHYVTKMLNGMIKHDTCSTARLQGFKLESLILKMAKEKGIKEEDLII